MRNIVLFLLVMILSGCGGFRGATTPIETRTPQEQRLEEIGTVFDEGGLFQGAGIRIGNQSVGSEQAGSIGVNSYLWYATLETLNFLPLHQVDPFGGVILTDWYSAPGNVSERIKLNVFITGRALRSDALRLSLFRENLDSSGNWFSVGASSDTVRKLENAILERARERRLQNISSPAE